MRPSSANQPSALGQSLSANSSRPQQAKNWPGFVGSTLTEKLGVGELICFPPLLATDWRLLTSRRLAEEIQDTPGPSGRTCVAVAQISAAQCWLLYNRIQVLLRDRTLHRLENAGEHVRGARQSDAAQVRVRRPSVRVPQYWGVHAAIQIHAGTFLRVVVPLFVPTWPTRQWEHYDFPALSESSDVFFHGRDI